MVKDPCFTCPLPDCVDPCPFGVSEEVDLDEYIFDSDSEYLKKEKCRLISKRFYQRHREELLVKQKQYRLKNKDKIKETQHKWYQKNKEEILAKHRKYRLENKAKINEHQRKVYQKNKDKILARQRKYRLKNKAKINEQKKNAKNITEGELSKDIA